ncbi:cation:proton antiporter [uncultured Faecalibaculum sp.]|uniref:cation:proton antiporter domain-containing protein n=1 Tax=uncultured Faecalibaculum sp. TaxID=1729681 RepID=UPI0026340D5B|nr:cation:proton antiporter [uncultured Faecalibaculum sp.]
MLTSIAIIVLSGLFVGRLFSKLKLPGLLGMILAGILLSPHALNLLDSSLLNISADLRQIALVIILTRAGLSLNLGDLKKVGRPAVLLCFVPACAEIIGTMLLAPPLLGVSLLEAAITGSVIAAVSPAVIVPRMIRLMENGYGRDHSIPQLLLAGASVDDVFVIVVFSALTSLASSGSFSALSLLQIPVSILTGVLAGMVTGLGLHAFFRSCPLRDTVKILILLSVSFLLLELQNRLEGMVPLSGLLAIMSLGIFLKRRSPDLARSLCDKYSLLWIPAEIFLFVLVGVTVDLQYAFAAGASAIVLVLGALVFRMAGVALSLAKTRLTGSEKLFCMIAYTPKATVQAAIGVIPLSMGLACGQKVLTVAVLAILITAPLGAIGIDKLYKKLLSVPA